MRNLLYVFAILLLITWGVGAYYKVGSAIHLILFVAIITIILGIFQKKAVR